MKKRNAEIRQGTAVFTAKSQPFLVCDETWKSSMIHPINKVPIVPNIAVANRNTPMATPLYRTSIVAYIIATAGDIQPSAHRYPMKSQNMLKAKLKVKRKQRQFVMIPKILMIIQTYGFVRG